MKPTPKLLAEEKRRDYEARLRLIKQEKTSVHVVGCASLNLRAQASLTEGRVVRVVPLGTTLTLTKPCLKGEQWVSVEEVNDEETGVPLFCLAQFVGP